MDDSTDVLFHRQLEENSRFIVLSLWEISTSQISHLEYHTAVTSKSEKFLKYAEDYLMSKILHEPTRKNALLDLLLVIREGFMGDVTISSRLGHRDQKKGGV